MFLRCIDETHHLDVLGTPNRLVWTELSWPEIADVGLGHKCHLVIFESLLHLKSCISCILFLFFAGQVRVFLRGQVMSM